MSPDHILWICDSLVEIAVVGFLCYRRIWRDFPAFFMYNLWTLLGNGAIVVILSGYSYNSQAYVTAYLVFLLIDSVLLLAVLVELAWSVLRPLHGRLPRTALLVVCAVIVAAGAAIWPFSSVPGIEPMGPRMVLICQLKQVVSTLSIMAFLVLAGGSRLLAIGWRNRELQIATGLGLYSVVGMIVTLLHTYPSMRKHYNSLDEVQVASFFCSLIYWMVSFAQKEEARHKMRPEIEGFLRGMGGSASVIRLNFAKAGAQAVGEQIGP